MRKKTRVGLSPRNRPTMTGVAPPSSGSAPNKPDGRYRVSQKRTALLLKLAQLTNAPTHAISRTFALVEICEDEIARAESPEKISFLALRPTDGMTSVVDGVYRSHCRELIARMLTGEPLEPGTTAECMLAVSRTSLDAPLTRTGYAIARRLFREIFGVDVDGDEPPETEAWPGAVDEELRVLRRKLARPRMEKSA